MERADFEWDVSRNGRTVRIDVIRAGSVTSVDTDAVVAATEELISDDGSGSSSSTDRLLRTSHHHLWRLSLRPAIADGEARQAASDRPRPAEKGRSFR